MEEMSVSRLKGVKSSNYGIAAKVINNASFFLSQDNERLTRNLLLLQNIQPKNYYLWKEHRTYQFPYK